MWSSLKRPAGRSSNSAKLHFSAQTAAIRESLRRAATACEQRGRGEFASTPDALASGQTESDLVPSRRLSVETGSEVQFPLARAYPMTVPGPDVEHASARLYGPICHVPATFATAWAALQLEVQPTLRVGYDWEGAPGPPPQAVVQSPHCV